MAYSGINSRFSCNKHYSFENQNQMEKPIHDSRFRINGKPKQSAIPITMEKTKLLTISVIGLLLLNFATLGFLFLNGPKGHRPPMGGTHQEREKPREIIIEKLHFDANQQKEYDKIIQWHHGEIEKLDKNIRQTKNELYSQLMQPEVDIKTKDSLITLLNSYQKQIEQTHFKHFEDIKKLCHKDQMDDFNELTEELARIFAPKPRGPEHD
jgi:protein CpxP